jgi:aspartyl-tRNA(Asn)/glutamyl-tRNA(Gln) amidotransferase subunit B
LEEDAGKSLHEDFQGMSGIDLNRAGTPLLEIVSEPDMRSAEEAVAYAKKLHVWVQWFDICDGNMQEGSFRCDANVSVRKPGAPLGTRREIKNLNSFRFLQQAIEYEAKWQIETLEDGGSIQQATVLFDPDSGETRMMRTKEDAHDYRYFPDPDLLPLEVSDSWIEDVRKQMPESPDSLRQRFVGEYGFTKEMAAILTTERERAEHFDAFWKHLIATVGPNVQTEEKLVQAASWAMMEIGSSLNRQQIAITEVPMSPQQLAVLVARIVDGTISHKIAKDVFEAMWNEAQHAELRSDPNLADAIIEARGLKQISDSGAIEKIVNDVLAANVQQVADYRAGKEKAFNSLVGQVMKASKGKANPAQVNEILKKKLS